MTLRFSLVLAALMFPVRSGFSQEKTPEPVTMSYSSVTESNAPLWIAKELGLFEKYASR